MEEKLNFKALIEKYRDTRDSVNVEEVKNENNSLLADIKDKNKKIANVEYTIEQNRNRLKRIKRTIENDPEFTENPEALLIEAKQKLDEAKKYKEQLKGKIKEDEKRLEANKRKLEEPEKVYNEVVTEAETKTDAINKSLKEKIYELEEERKKYGILTKDKDGKPIRRITPEERIIIENITENINKLNNQITINNSKLDKFKALIEQMKGSNKTVSNEEKSTGELTNAEPINSEPTNSEPTNSEPANAESANVEPINAEPTNIEPVNVKSSNVKSANIELTNSDSTRTKKLIEVKVNGKKYEFTYEDNGEISSESKEKIGFFKGLKERFNLLRQGKFRYNRTAFKVDPTITQNLSKEQMRAYISFLEQRGKEPAPFIVKYDKEKGIMAKAFAKSAEKLGLPEAHKKEVEEEKDLNEKFGDGFDQHANPPIIVDKETTNEVQKVVEQEKMGHNEL